MNADGFAWFVSFRSRVSRYVIDNLFISVELFADGLLGCDCFKLTQSHSGADTLRGRFTFEVKSTSNDRALTIRQWIVVPVREWQVRWQRCAITECDNRLALGVGRLHRGQIGLG
jgi:hypothetical protein